MTEIRRVSPADAQALLEQGYVYVDVRSVAEFEAGHPKGAFNVPVTEPDFLSVMQGRFGKDDKIVVGCLAGGRSLKAATMLLGAGFADVVDQRAGWGGVRNTFGAVSEAGWERAGLPSETSTEPGKSYDAIKAGKRA
jgi:rhodanese-related sulfurtransferase